MALEKQTLSFPFFLGRDGGSDPKVVRESLLEAKNVIHDTDGKLSKRPPLHTISYQSEDNPPPLVAADSRHNICLGALYGTSGGSDKPGATTPRPSVSLRASRIIDVVSVGGGSAVGAMTFGPKTGSGVGDLRVNIQEANGAYRASVEIDSETNKVTDDTKLLSTVHPAVLYSSYLGWVTGGITWDCWDLSTSVKAYILSGTLYAELYNSGGSLIASDTVVLHGSAQTDRIGVAGTKIYVQGDATSAYKVYYYNMTGSGLSGPTSTNLTTTPYDNGLMTSFAVVGDTIAATFDYPSEAYDVLHVDYITQRRLRIPKGSKIVSHGFTDSASDTNYLLLRLNRTSSSVQVGAGAVSLDDSPTLLDTLLLITDSLETITPIFPGEALAYDEGSEWVPCSHPVQSGDNFLICTLVGATFPSVAVLSINPANPRQGSLPVVKYGNSYWAAAPNLVDAASVRAMYAPAPQGVTLHATGTGSLTTDGAYNYILVPVYRGGGGRFIYGQPTKPVPVTLSGGVTAVDVSVRDELTSDDDGSLVGNQEGVISYQIYRTAAGGSTYGYVGAILPFYSTTFTDTISDTGRSTVAYFDINGYNTGHSLPPPAADTWIHDDRLWIIPADSPDVAWFSRRRPDFNRATITPAGEGPSFSAYDTLAISPASTPLRGTSFGGACLIFTDKAVYIIGGEGPDDSGNGSFASPQQLAVPPLGDERSLVNLGSTLVYKSGSSWVKLDRGFNATDIGNGVSDYDSMSVLSAVRRTGSKAQFLLSDGLSSLIFDADTNQWFLWVYNELETGVDTYTLDRIVARENSDSIVAQANVIIAQEPYPFENVVYRDDDSFYGFKDYTMAVETRWFNLNKFAGFQRLYEVALLGEYKDQHTITLKIYYDYDDSTPAETITKTFTASTVPYIIRWQPAKQVNRAFKVRVEETSPGGTTYESFTLTGFEATIGVKPRTHYTTGETA